MYDRKADFDWFNENRDNIINGHIGERVVIQNKSVKGYFASDRDAIDGMRSSNIGQYIIQRCLAEDDDTEFYYTGRFALA